VDVGGRQRWQEVSHRTGPGCRENHCCTGIGQILSVDAFSAARRSVTPRMQAAVSSLNFGEIPVRA
jgi:hypothetical protein